MAGNAYSDRRNLLNVGIVSTCNGSYEGMLSLVRSCCVSLCFVLFTCISLFSFWMRQHHSFLGQEILRSNTCLTVGGPCPSCLEAPPAPLVEHPVSLRPATEAAQTSFDQLYKRTSSPLAPEMARSLLLSALALPFLHLISHSGALPAPAAPTTCNGQSHYCSLTYPNLALPTQNQHLSVGDQLSRGFRFLQGQTHDLGGTLEMCHTSCLEEDAGSLQSFFTTVRDFLDKNPAELITLLLVNGDNKPAATFDDALKAADLKKYAFVPPGDAGSVLALDAWPIVGDMLKDGPRVVVFLDAGADARNYPALLDEFSYFFETPYDVTNANDFKKCDIDRPSGSRPDGKMYLVNHFLDIQLPFGGIKIPNALEAGTTNSPGSIRGQADVCKGLYGRGPKGVLLDYVDAGDPLAWERSANGV